MLRLLRQASNMSQASCLSDAAPVQCWHPCSSCLLVSNVPSLSWTGFMPREYGKAGTDKAAAAGALCIQTFATRLGDPHRHVAFGDRTAILTMVRRWCINRAVGDPRRRNARAVTAARAAEASCPAEVACAGGPGCLPARSIGCHMHGGMAAGHHPCGRQDTQPISWSSALQ